MLKLLHTFLDPEPDETGAPETVALDSSQVSN